VLELRLGLGLELCHSLNSLQMVSMLQFSYFQFCIHEVEFAEKQEIGSVISEAKYSRKSHSSECRFSYWICCRVRLRRMSQRLGKHLRHVAGLH
jgi:hypothetical protein